MAAANVRLFVTTGTRPSPDPDPLDIAEWRVKDAAGKTVQTYSWDGIDWRLKS